MGRRTVHFILAACFLVVSLASDAAPRNIFDDDWSPPKPAAGDSGAARRAIPAKPEQAAVRKVLRELYADQLNDRSIPARRKLADALLAQADKSADSPADQFVLLAAAADAAIEAANLPLAIQAANRINKTFDVDGAALNADVAIRIAARQSPPDLAGDNIRAALELTDQLAQANDLAAASRVCAAFLPVSAADPALRADVQKRQKEITATRDAAEKVARHLATLKANHDDPLANAEVGKYLCFYRNDWKAGLAALARGNDATLKAAAVKELAAPEAADAQAAVGDAWWDIAQSPAAAPAKSAIQAHAAQWYRQASPNLKGLGKAKIDKRLANATATEKTGAKDGWTDLLRQVDTTRDAVRGAWSLEDGQLRIVPGAAPARLRIPVKPEHNYQLQIELQRPGGGDAFGVYLPVGDKAVTLLIRPKQIGLDTVDGKRFDVNETTKVGDFDDNAKRTLDFAVSWTVRDAHITVAVDGKPQIDWKGPVAKLAVTADWALPAPQTLGFGSWNTAFVVSSARLKDSTRR